MFQQLIQTIHEINSLPISAKRISVIEPLVVYISQKLIKREEVRLNFICTHNSRRSQLAQVWGQTAAEYHKIKIQCLSGGTEVTAFNQRAVDSLKRSGFRVNQVGSVNPVFKIYHSDPGPGITAYSKLYDDPGNQNGPFAAVMTCDHAEANCPYIPGAEERISLLYEDPKAYDNSSLESKMYDERSFQIASEMFYVFSQVKSRL